MERKKKNSGSHEIFFVSGTKVNQIQFASLRPLFHGEIEKWRERESKREHMSNGEKERD